MKKVVVILTALMIFTACVGCGNENVQKSLTVSAAISLKGALDEIGANFEKENNIKINFNYGGSGVLQKQIEEGAPVDVFISAGKAQMDRLQSEQMIDSSTRVELLKNELVLISINSSEGVKAIEELGTKKVTLAIGEVKTVPAGMYAKESLENLGLWEEVSLRTVYGKDVKDVLRYVQKGEVQAGIVYESDIIDIDNSYNIINIPESSHGSIIYPAAMISGCKNKEIAKAFIKFIRNSESRSIFEEYKFNVKE